MAIINSTAHWGLCVGVSFLVRRPFFYGINIYNKENPNMRNLDPLLKSVKNLLDLAFIYLFITWTYQGMDFVIRSLF